MKKTMLTCAAAAAMILSSCNDERVPVESGKGGGVTAQTGYASVTIDLGDKTRALTDYNPTTVTGNDANDKKIGFDDLYLLIFKADPTGALEYTAKLNNNAADGNKVIGTSLTHTALLTAGDKKIFVLANLGTESNHAISKLLNSVDATSMNWEDMKYTPGADNITLSEFQSIVFNAGTPQAYNVDKSGLPTFSTAALSTPVSSLFGLPMSSSSSKSFTLTGNVTKEDAENETNATSDNGTNPNNRFKVQLDYLGAKARLYMDPASFPQATKDAADISNPVYTVKNLARYTSLVANVTTGADANTPNSSSSYYHVVDWKSPTETRVYTDEFDQALNIIEPVKTDKSGGFIYVPENTNGTLLRGQSSFFAMKATYKPKKIVKAVSFNPMVDAGTGNVAFTSGNIDSWANLATATLLEGGNKYYYYNNGIAGVNNDINAGAGEYKAHYFASARVFADALWVAKWKKAMNAPAVPGVSPAYSADDANALFQALVNGTDYEIFTNGESYYRLDIGTGSGDATEYGVSRGNAYTAQITNIAGPGVPDEGSLFENPDEAVKAVTYINVSIEAADWHVTNQNGEVK